MFNSHIFSDTIETVCHDRKITKCSVLIIKQDSLEQRQYKKDSIQSKIILLLKLPRFSPNRIVSEKAGISKLESFLIE